MNGRRVWLNIWKGWIELWWFPKDTSITNREVGGYWQILGHLFKDVPFLETVFHCGRHCGRGIANAFIFFDWWQRKLFSPFLSWWVKKND